MNILTIDIEEWYLYELYLKGGKDYYLPIIKSYLDQILDLLDETSTKATFFCLGIIARTDPGIIKQIIARGHEIGCHSDKHIVLNKMTPAVFKEDTLRAIDSLQQIVGKKIEMYRAPAFSISEKTIWALELLIEQGVKFDSSIFPAKHSAGGFAACNLSKPGIIVTKSGIIKEFPINYIEFVKRIMFSGGGYFRLLPYPIIKKFTLDSDYNMAYFHIRDFDSKQKKVRSLKYFQSYYGIHKSFEKFQQYIREFEFISMGQAAEKIEWFEVNDAQLS